MSAADPARGCPGSPHHGVRHDGHGPSFAAQLAIALIRGYKLLFSPMFAGSCRFVPSCSAYAVEAIARFGVVRGSWLALGRLGRCRPLAAHGFDPVPPRAAHD
jgi:putative membrane protein insertion efficiency factor